MTVVVSQTVPLPLMVQVPVLMVSVLVFELDDENNPAVTLSALAVKVPAVNLNVAADPNVKLLVSSL